MSQMPAYPRLSNVLLSAYVRNFGRNALLSYLSHTVHTVLLIANMFSLVQHQRSTLSDYISLRPPMSVYIRLMLSNIKHIKILVSPRSSTRNIISNYEKYQKLHEHNTNLRSITRSDKSIARILAKLKISPLS